MDIVAFSLDAHCDCVYFETALRIAKLCARADCGDNAH